MDNNWVIGCYTIHKICDCMWNGYRRWRRLRNRKSIRIGAFTICPHYWTGSRRLSVAEVWGHVTTDGQSVNTSWRLAQLGTCDQILILSEFRCVVFVGRPLWREVGSVSCQSLSARIVHCQFFLLFSFVCFFFPFYTSCILKGIVIFITL
jgi:hypothetical protein